MGIEVAWDRPSDDAIRSFKKTTTALISNASITAVPAPDSNIRRRRATAGSTWFFQTRDQPENDTIPFEPSDGRNTLVPACSQAPHNPVSDLPKVTFNPAADAFQDDQQPLREWISERGFRTGKIVYDYQQPRKDVTVTKEASERAENLAPVPP